MLKAVPIKDLPQHVGEVVTVCGWVATIRDQKKRQFLIVRDRTGLVQVINEKDGREILSTTISGLTPESTIQVTGKVVSNEKIKLGQLELVLESIEVLTLAASPLPISEGATQEKRLDWRFYSGLPCQDTKLWISR